MTDSQSSVRTLSSAGRSIVLRCPPANYYIQRLRDCEPYTFVKINHGYWELVLAYERLGSSERGDPKAVDRRFGRSLMFEGGFYDEFQEMLGALPRAAQLHFGVSPFAHNGSLEIEGTPLDLPGVIELISRTMDPGVPLYDGVVMKHAALEGRLRDFKDAVAPYPVVLVGPKHLKIAMAGWGSSLHHVVIDAKHAKRERDDILAQLRALRSDIEGKVVVVLQASVLAPWLALKCSDRWHDTFFLDMGRALDALDPRVLLSQPWGALYRYQLEVMAGLEAPTAVPGIFPPPVEAHEWGASSDVVAKARAPGVRPVRFIEEKPVDHVLVESLLKSSEQTGQWSNFGPVSRTLEEHARNWMRVPQDMSVVACSSGTSALHALVRLYEYLHRKRLRWVVPSFNFPCAIQGPLADATVLDTDASGMLDLKQLRALDPNSFDGVVLTNLFERPLHLARFEEACNELGKVLVVDAATGFDAERDAWVAHAISLHHTKPWGMGEGGLAVVPSEHEKSFRSLINFGTYSRQVTGRFSTNAKMSDFAAAFCLQRLRDFEYLQPHYHGQYRRLLNVGRKCGLRPLHSEVSVRFLGGTPASVPLVSEISFPIERLENSHFTVRRYYRPLEDNPNAKSIYDRLVCVPCHPGMASIADEHIMEVLARVSS